MRVLITGLNGTLAPRVAVAVRWRGWGVIGWDRRRADPEDADTAQRWLHSQRPDAVVHLATGSAAWASLLAEHAQTHGVPMVFASTAMVFDHHPDGPHQPQHERTAKDAYGRSKIAAEDAVRAASSQVTIARFGWQIDATRPGNNMLLQLDEWQQREGHIAASRAWRPACSFMDDTAAALVALLAPPQAHRPGNTVHLDSNADEGHSFDRIVAALQLAYGRTAWQIRVHEDYRHDQRLAAGNSGGGLPNGLKMPPLSARLPL